MRKLLASLLVFSSCATFFNAAPQTYCGNVDVLSVYTEGNCKEAMQITNDAYELLWQKAAGPLNEQWRVEFTWGAIDVSGSWAKTDPRARLIVVRSVAMPSIFHELLHAYMMETHTGGRNQHRKMCANKVWRKLEDDFGVKPYCHLIYDSKFPVDTATSQHCWESAE